MIGRTEHTDGNRPPKQLPVPGWAANPHLRGGRYEGEGEDMKVRGTFTNNGSGTVVENHQLLTAILPSTAVAGPGI